MAYLQTIERKLSPLSVCFIIFLFACCSSFISISALASDHETTEQKKLINLTDKEKNWIAEHPRITFGTGKNWEPFVIKDSRGTLSGIEVELIKRINELAGTNIQIVLGKWPTIVKKAQAREIDGLLVSVAQEKRAPYFLFSDSLYNVYKYIFSTTLKIKSMDDLKGKRVAYQGGILIHEKFFDRFPDIIPVPAENTPALALMLENKQVDAVLGGNILKYFLQEGMFTEAKLEYIVPESKEEVLYSIRKDWPELLSIINKAMAKISPEEVGRFKRQWFFPNQSESTEQVSLSKKERAWLEKNQTIQVRITDFPPFIIPQKDGPPTGIAIDSLKLITERTGVKFNLVSSGKTFREALDGIKNHQGPDVIATIVRTPEREKSILFTRDFLRSPWMIFMRADRKTITTGMEDLIGKKVALLKGGALKDMMTKEYPGVQQVLFNTHIKAIDAVANNEAEAYVGNLTLTSYYLLRSGQYNLKLAAPSSFGDQVLSMGVRNDWPELTSILDKGLASISPEEHTAIRNKYISLHLDKSDTSKYLSWILLVAGGAAAIILLFWFWNRSLTKQVTARTAELKDSEIKYRNVLESTSTVPWELDLNSGKFTFMGNQIEKILGYSPESWKDITVWGERVHHEDRDGAIQFCETQTKKGQDHDFVYRARHTDGSYRWIRDVVSVIEGESGPVALVGFMHDITEQKELAIEKELLQKRWEQSQKLEAIGTLAGGIAHDFNNILSAILGFTDLAKESLPVGSEISDDLDEVLTAANRATALVQQILAFSRQSQLIPIPLQPNLIVKEALKMLRSSIPTTIQIQENISQDCGTIIADPTQVHQIMMNLCTNAFHAMENTGGTMTIELKRATFIPPDLAESTFGYIELSVSDTGTGIDPKTIDMIFDPFFTTKEQGKGTGMGLSIIYGIVKEQGGDVTVESQLGKGSTFHVYLPRFEETSDSGAIKETVILGGSESILFVDDEQNITKVAQKMLERAGYTVTVKMDSFEAWKTFQNQPDAFDLVITDHTMPGMTGLELSKRILQMRPAKPIILCSGYSSTVNEATAKALGIKEYISKPFSKESMTSSIRKVLDTP